MLSPLLATMPPATSGSVLPVAVLPATMLLRPGRIAHCAQDPAALGVVARRAVAADRAVGQRHVEARRDRSRRRRRRSPVVLLPLTVLLVSVT